MALRGRDDFTRKTVELLAKRAGGKCSMCGCTTWGPNDNHHRATNIGQAAHIAAAAEGGPRYDKTMSSEDRSSILNGLWLCSNCHDKVDRNVDSYTTQHLSKLKNEAESRAKRELGVATSHSSLTTNDTDIVHSCVSAAAIIEIRKAKSLLATMHGQKVGWEEAKRIIEAVDFIRIPGDGYILQVGTELMSLLQRLLAYSHDPVLILEVIRRVKEVVDGYHSVWEEEEVRVVCEMMEDLAKRQKKPSNKVFQSAVALVKDLSQLIGQRDATLGNIPKTTLRSLIATRRTDRRRPITKGGGKEEVDYDDGELPPSKMATLSSDVEQYLEKMAVLAQVNEVGDRSTPSDVTQRCLDIEEEIKQCGFEPNIL